MAGASEHNVTIAFMNIGLMESAFQGAKSQHYLKVIKEQVDQLFRYHSVRILCFVEAGQPRIGLIPDSKARFEQAVRDGASEHTRGSLVFLWADRNESLLTVHVADIDMTKGDIIDDLYHLQSWRNAMPCYLQGPTSEDRILILLSHQPSSKMHNYSMQCKESVIRKLMATGLEQRHWPDGSALEHPRFIIGGDLNMTASALKMMALSFTDSASIALPKVRQPRSGDVAVGVNMHIESVESSVKNRDPGHDLVLVRFPWPSTSPAARRGDPLPRQPLQGI